MNPYIMVVLCALIVIAPGVHAHDVQSLDLLRHKIEQHVMESLQDSQDGRVKITLEKTDSRLQLKACAESRLEVFNPHSHSVLQATALGIRCQEADNHWTLYMPVRISFYKKVYALKHAMSKGQNIREDDVHLIEKDIRQLKKGYFTDISQMIGQICKQNLPEDALLSPQDVQQPRMILKGQQVSIMAGKDGFSVRMSGIALRDGVLGEMVQVKNISSKKVIEARVSGQQQVQVNL